MSEMQDQSRSLSRREALKALAAASGAVMLASMPQSWDTPVVQVGSLPVHAQGSTEASWLNPQSPADYSFENEAPEIDLGDSGLQAQTTGDGWIVISNGTSAASEISGVSKSKPWRDILRYWDVFAPAWPVAHTVRIKFKFKKKSGYGSSHKIKDSMAFWFYGISAVTQQYYAYQTTVVGDEAAVDYQLPAATENFFPFYCSGYFPVDIVLVGGYIINPGYYLGWGVYGGKYSYSKK